MFCLISIDWKFDRKYTNCKNMHPQKTDIKAVQSLKLLLFYLSCEWTHAQRMVSTVWANGKRMVSAHWTEICKHLWIVNGEWTQRTNGAQTRAQSERWTICAPIWTHGEHTVNAQKKWEIITFQGLWLGNKKFSNLHVQYIQWKLFVIHKVCKSS